MNKKTIETVEKKRYSEEELKEFEGLLLIKLERAKQEFKDLRETLTKKNDPGTDSTANNSKLMEDGSDTLEKESIMQLAARQQKFIQQLENALIRIKNHTYGVCIDTGKLIARERLLIVPHTQHSVEAKNNKK